MNKDKHIWKEFSKNKFHLPWDDTQAGFLDPIYRKADTKPSRQVVVLYQTMLEEALLHRRNIHLLKMTFLTRQK